MKYTYHSFIKEYPNDTACLMAVFNDRYGDYKRCPKCAKPFSYSRVKQRQCYACAWCANQLYPLADTIFRKSTTPLWNWFYAIYLFSVSNNGVSAPELQKHLGVTYKTAWRMCKLIRQLMAEEGVTLGGSGGPVEVDEFEYGHKGKANNTMAFGAVERGGKAKMQVTDTNSTARSMSFVRANMEAGIELYSDGSRIYQWTDKEYKHSSVIHAKRQWAHGDTHINTIEGIWGYIEGAIDGTYRGVSPKYLQHYLDEFIYRYNHKNEAICSELLAKAAQPV